MAGLISYSSLCKIFPWRFLILALLQSWSEKSGDVFYQPPSNIFSTGTVASNHDNLLTTANCPVLWHYGVPHAEVNGT